MRRAIVCVCATTLAIVGCESAHRPAGFENRDSAGVHIVVNDRHDPTTANRILVESEPALTIGTLDGRDEQQLFRVRDATRLPDGRLAVVNGGTSEVRFYDADGVHLRSVGGRGEGPGEFQVVRWIHRVGDTLVLYDGALDNGRATYLTLAGDLITTRVLSTEERRFPNPTTVLPDGTFLDAVDRGSIPADEMGYVRFTLMPVRYPPSGTSVDTITAVPGSDMFRWSFLTAVMGIDVPFGREAYLAAGLDRIFTGNGDEAAVDVFDFSGTHRMSIRFPEQPVAVTPERVERWIEQKLDSPSYRDNPEAAQEARERYETPPVPSTMPAHAELVVDEGQRLWVRRYTPPWAPSHDWMVFDPDGLWLGDVSLPLDLRVFEIGDGYILGVSQDELSVEYLQLYHWSLADRR